MRVYIEFQYAESLTFFALWNKFNQIGLKEKNDDNMHNFCVLQYLDIVYPDGPKPKNPPRSIPFPKYLILEQRKLSSSSRDTYIRIHEKHSVDIRSEDETLSE